MSASTLSQRIINGQLIVIRDVLSDDPVIQLHNDAMRNAWDVQTIVDQAIASHDSIVAVVEKDNFSIFDLRDLTENLLSWLDVARQVLSFARTSKVNGYTIDRVSDLEGKVYAVANAHDVLNRQNLCARKVIAGTKVKLKDWANGLRRQSLGRSD